MPALVFGKVPSSVRCRLARVVLTAADAFNAWLRSTYTVTTATCKVELLQLLAVSCAAVAGVCYFPNPELASQGTGWPGRMQCRQGTKGGP